MKLVYICSPLRGDHKKNIAKANEYARENKAFKKETVPLHPHCVFHTVFRR